MQQNNAIIQSQPTSQQEMDDKIRKLQQMKQQEEEFDKHLAQTVSVSHFMIVTKFFCILNFFSNKISIKLDKNFKKLSKL